jgi:hypothetical protein
MTLLFVMEKLHCPKCKSDHIIVQNRRRYFSLAALCLLIIIVCYLVLRTPVLKSSDWSSVIMVLIIAIETALCIAIIMGIYYFALGVFKRQTSYTCRRCKCEFESGVIVPNGPSGEQGNSLL